MLAELNLFCLFDIGIYENTNLAEQRSHSFVVSCPYDACVWIDGCSCVFPGFEKLTYLHIFFLKKLVSNLHIIKTRRRFFKPRKYVVDLKELDAKSNHCMLATTQRGSKVLENGRT